MAKHASGMPVWLPYSTLAFFAGMLLYGLASGVLTGAEDDAIEMSRQLGYELGYTRAKAESPPIETQEQTIQLISSAVFLDNMEVEIKEIARLTNAITFAYGEKGRERYLQTALDVGDAIAHRMETNLYVIKNVSVSANLQRATVEVMRVRLPSE